MSETNKNPPDHGQQGQEELLPASSTASASTFKDEQNSKKTTFTSALRSSAKEVPERKKSKSLGAYSVQFDSNVRDHNINARNLNGDGELMGPILRRKKIISLPLGLDPRHTEFFHGSLEAADASVRSGGGSFSEGSPGQPRRTHTNDSFMKGILRRKQVSLDLVGAEEADFFSSLRPGDEELVLPSAPELAGSVSEGDKTGTGVTKDLQEVVPVKLFKPLQFSPPRRKLSSRGAAASTTTDAVVASQYKRDEANAALESQLEHQKELMKRWEVFSTARSQEDVSCQLKGIREMQDEVEKDTQLLKAILLGADNEDEVETASEEKIQKDVLEDASEVKRATKLDYLWTGVLVCVMMALTATVVGWETHLDESHSEFGPVGLACATPCLGDLESQDYFNGHSHFDHGDYIQLIMRLDPNPDTTATALVQIVGTESGQEKAAMRFGPPDIHYHQDFKEKVKVDFDNPQEHHIINVYSVPDDTVPTSLSCTTPCNGDLQSQDFFGGHNTFTSGESIQLVMQFDPDTEEHAHVIVDIVGVQSDTIKATREFIAPDQHHGNDTQHSETMFFTATVEVDFENPGEEHIIHVYSADEDAIIGFTLSTYTNDNTVLTYTLHASRLSPLAGYSVLIAALIMICVYLLILLEWIHRTLVAIFGSMVALLFLFAIHMSETESIGTIMLHMEWSTLGLLFGMMIIVGELSHTGIFEWLAVRILVASRGSYNRLMILLCLLTAVSSAFLDNVTTMLLVAPVTIDMCSILSVDPRPYLIGEVILSNVGGTATLIGDPPNIIIGSAFEEIGFVDFIIHVLPCIFLFCIPVSIMLVLCMYRYYLTSSKMPELDTQKLNRTYRVYDEPRLLIAGTVAFFVVAMFFMHPLHHKDTAWIALIGAFVTMTFTNPHDVQDALRNHVEFDTLLFFAGLFVLVEVCAHLGLLEAIGAALAGYIESQPEDNQLTIAITLILWVSAFTSAFLDNIPYTATMIPVVQILSDSLPDTLPIKTLAWALSFGACLGGNGTLLGASANIVTAGISTNRGFDISFLNFFYPGMIVMITTVALANLYMLIVYVWV